MDKDKITERFGIKIPCWNESLQACIKNISDKI